MSAAATILVVEDNPATRKMLRIALATEGYTVIEAPDGGAALEAAKVRLPDLIIQDLVLPDLPGFELVTRLRALPGAEAMVIIALSGFIGQLEEARIARAGFTTALAKPVEPSVLVETVASYLPRSRSRPIHAENLILVVEDDPIQLKLLRVQLREMGFRVAVASGAIEALRAAEREHPDAILSDVLMPELDGFQLCGEIRSSPSLAHIPVVLLSAHYRSDADQTLARRMGANALLTRTPALDGVADALVAAMAAGAPRLPEPISDASRLEHAKAVIRQLERQLTLTAGLARRCTLQAAQLSLLGGITAALASNSDFDLALRDVLAATLDTAAISKGALFLRPEHQGPLQLRHDIGFSALEQRELSGFFGETPTLEQIVADRVAVSIPSKALSEAASRRVMELADIVYAEIVPLVSKDRGIGAIFLGAKRTDVPSEDAVAFARAIGNQIVHSLELESAFRSLMDSEQRYRTLMESANDGIAILDSDGVVREVNHRLEEALGRPRAEIVGRVGPAFTQPGEDRSGPVEIARPDGAPVLLECSNTEAAVGKETLRFSIARDVTEQVRANAQLMASDRMASVGMLAAGVAHEINNPLAALMVNLEFAAEALDAAQSGAAAPDLPELQEVLADARESAERVRAIAQDLKTFSRAEEDSRGPVDVHHILESSLRMARTEIRHRAVVVKEYGRIAPVIANDSRLGQVFLNLIVNAAQAMPEGHADRNTLRIRTQTRPGDGGVVVEISDTGPGIPPEIAAKVFTPFFTTKGGGTGLGLAICRRILGALGGEITLTSEVGKGTTATVRLPAAEHQPAAVKPMSAVASASRRGRVLVVDDEAIVGTMIRRIIGREHDVEVTDSGREALARITAGERFDVILCDVTMPVLTGLEFRAELARAVPEQAERIVFVTGAAFVPRTRQALDEVPNARIDKPFDIATLRRLVNARVQ